jgi:hypothetical protein
VLGLGYPASLQEEERVKEVLETLWSGGEVIGVRKWREEDNQGEVEPR